MKIIGVIFLLLNSLLTGCVAAMVGNVASGLEKDARIFYVAHTAIVQDPRFAHSRIVVSCFNQVVLLLGQTPVASLRNVAEKVAQNAPNVRRVYNEITLDHPLSLAAQSKDTWITGQVRSKMLTQKGLESGSIHVITENQVVYLMGIVTPEHATRAVEVARQIKGVRKVVKVFQYIR